MNEHLDSDPAFEKRMERVYRSVEKSSKGLPSWVCVCCGARYTASYVNWVGPDCDECGGVLEEGVK